MADHIDPKTLEELSQSDGSFLQHPDMGFSANRGVTQGGTESTVAWIVIFDMILCWSDLKDDSQDKAYADDLSQITNSIATAQMKADRLSSFCAFTGMQLAIAKTECIAIGSPFEVEAMLDTEPTITIRDWNWNPHTIPIRATTVPTKYLGVLLPFSSKDTDSHAWCVDYVTTSATHLRYKCASPDCKLLVLNTQVLPTLLYKATKASWTYDRYLDIDKLLARAARKVLRLPPGYPTALIYLPTKYKGLGLRKFSTWAQTQKWHTLQRAITLGGEPKRAAISILQRHDHNRPDIDLYITSLVQWGQQLGIRLQPPSPATPQFRETIDKVQTQLQLHNNHPHDFQAIFTDGSFTRTNLSPAHLLGDAHVQPATHNGGAAIVWLPPKTNWSTGITKILRLTAPEHTLPGITPYTYETLAMSAALTFSKLVSPTVPMCTDCQAVQTRTTEALSRRRRALGTKPQGIFYECLATGNHRQRPIRWVRSHPERRTQDRNNWTYNDYGIYIADAAASGEWSAIDKILGGTNYSVVTTEITHLIDEFLTAGQWQWRRYDKFLHTDCGPMLGDVTELQHQWDLHQYILTRDGTYPASASRDSQYWTRSGTRLPHKLHPLKPNNSPNCYVPFHDRIRETAYVWDKSYAMGRNRAKGKHGDELTTAAKCTDCDHNLDNMAHMLLHCPHPEIAQLREHAFHTQQTQLTKLHGQRQPIPWLHTALQRLARAAWDPTTPQVERYWTGQLTASQLANAFGHNISTTLHDHQFHKLEKSVTKVLLPLYNGGINMLKNRGCRFHSNDATAMTPTSTHASSQQCHTNPTTNPTILQLLKATSTPRAVPHTRPRPQRRPANPIRRQTTLISDRTATTTSTPKTSADTHPQNGTSPPTPRLACGYGPPDTLPKGRPPD